MQHKQVSIIYALSTTILLIVSHSNNLIFMLTSLSLKAYLENILLYLLKLVFPSV